MAASSLLSFYMYLSESIIILLFVAVLMGYLSAPLCACVFKYGEMRFMLIAVRR